MSTMAQAKKINSGQDLLKLANHGTNTLNTLKNIKLNLDNIKEIRQNDPDFSGEEVSEVDVVITTLGTEIGEFLNSIPSLKSAVLAVIS